MIRKKIFTLTTIFALLVFLACVAGMTSSCGDCQTKDEKPVIYLYPETDSYVSVYLDISGEIIESIPDYGNGWNVFVTKDGLISGKYEFLFYEAILPELVLPDEGWVIEGSSLSSWLDINLPILGLNEKESREFKEYWVSRLPQSNYYMIKLLDKEFLSENVKLTVFPEPDTIIRLTFYFQLLPQKIDLAEPEIVTPDRKGFTVVEWGGIVDE